MTVICALCGARRRNDESVLWLGRTWDEREPFCAEDCAKVRERELAAAEKGCTCDDPDGPAVCDWCRGRL